LIRLRTSSLSFRGVELGARPRGHFWPVPVRVRVQFLSIGNGARASHIATKFLEVDPRKFAAGVDRRPCRPTVQTRVQTRHDRAIGRTDDRAVLRRCPTARGISKTDHSACRIRAHSGRIQGSPLRWTTPIRGRRFESHQVHTLSEYNVFPDQILFRVTDRSGIFVFLFKPSRALWGIPGSPRDIAPTATPRSIRRSLRHREHMAGVGEQRE
jgi:hypothetical protein